MNNQSEHINELASALSKCQGEMSFAVKDSINPAFKSKYADLSDVWDAIREPLAKHNLCVVQAMDEHNNKVVLITTLMHSSGQWIRSILPIKTDKDTCQGWGSGITYSRRYALAAMVGCVQDDDDGNAAEPKQKPKPKTEEEKQREEEEKRKEAEREGQLIIEFIGQYPEENEQDISAFLGTLQQAWRKPYAYILEKYRNHELFMNDFGKWKAKQGK